MRFISLVMLFIAAMLISVSQTAAPLVAQTLTAKLNSKPQASPATGMKVVAKNLPPGAACKLNDDCASNDCDRPESCYVSTAAWHACKLTCN